MFYINIKKFHINDGPNKIVLPILSQLTITKVNTIENFGKENNKITLQGLNARIPKKKKRGRRRRKKDNFRLRVQFTSMIFLLAT